MVALAVNPPGQADFRADIGGAQLGAMVRAIRVHELSLGIGAALSRPLPFCQPAALAMGLFNMKIHKLISDNASLAALVERLASAPFVAVDTEFMRENSYWPELCLIQVASGEEAAAIAYIQIKSANGKVRWGAGVDTNIAFASIRAVLSALNRL